MNSSPPTVSKFLRSADGTVLYANAVGDPSKPAIVFIHGYLSSSTAFDSVFEDPRWLDQVYLVRYDSRGYGKSGKPEDEASWESQRIAEDFDAVVQEFGLKKPFIAGWSLGACNIVDVVSFYPSSYLSGIIQLSPVPHLGPVATTVSTPAALTHGQPPFFKATNAAESRVAAQNFVSLCSDFLPHHMYEACVSDASSIPLGVIRRLFSRTQNEQALLKLGRESDFPLLLINGTQDKLVVGAETKKVMEGWRNLTMVDMHNSGHMVWVEEPERFRKEVLQWVEMVSDMSCKQIQSQRRSRL